MKKIKFKQLHRRDFILFGFLLGIVILIVVLTENIRSGFNFKTNNLQTTNLKTPSVSEVSELFNYKNFYSKEPIEIHLKVRPEFIAALDAAVPEGRVCNKVRYKKVPIEKFKINDYVVNGKKWLRYRGYCYGHWITEQKSFKISLENEVLGYDTFNINALATDMGFFEPWVSQLFEASGTIAARVTLARVYINGRYDGLRFLVENLDGDLVRNQGLKKGHVYREKTHAFLGHEFTEPNSEGIFVKYPSLENIKRLWKKNTRKNKGWETFQNFNDAINDGINNGSELWKDFINFDAYLKYLAIIHITGTFHNNNHNIPLYRPKGSDAFTLIGYDFLNSYASDTKLLREDSPTHYFSHTQIPFIIQNWLHALVIADDKLRARLHSIIREMLIALKPEELGEANAQRAKQLLDKYYKKGEIWYDPVGEIWNAASNDVKRNKSSIKRRVDFLERQYLKPTLYSNNKKDIDGSFQAYLSAMGNFEFELLIEPNIACSNLDFLPPKLDINFKYAFNLAKCENGKVTAVKQKISTNKIYLEGIKMSPSNVLRPHVGGMLLDIYSKYKHKGIKIVDMSSSSEIKPKNTWDLNIKNLGEFRFEINEEKIGKQKEEQIGILNYGFYEKPKLRSFTYNNYKIEPISNFAATNVQKPYQENKIEPIFCFQQEDNSGCIEIPLSLLKTEVNNQSPEVVNMISKNLLVNSSERQETNFKLILAKDILNCDQFEFKTSLYKIKENLIFNKKCKIKFHDGAKLEFTEGMYMILQGNVEFPKTGQVFFTGYKIKPGVELH
jgi:hypothetical protein